MVRSTKKRMTYTDVEALLSNRFPSATLGDEEAQANHRLSWSGSSYSNYLFPRPMSDPQIADETSRSRRDSTSSSPKRATLKKRRTFSDASLNQRAAKPQTHSSPSEEPVAGPSRLQSDPTFASGLPSELSSGLSHSATSSHLHNTSEDVGLAFPGFSQIDSFRSYVSSQAHYQPLSASSTIRSRPKTPATVSTRIDEQEFLDMADFVYASPVPPVPPLPLMAPVPRKGYADVPASGGFEPGPRRWRYDKVREQSDETGPFTPTVVDSGYDDCSPHTLHDISADNHSINSNDMVYRHTSHLASSRHSVGTLDGWVEYISDTQSLRTISKRPAHHTHSSSHFSKFSEFEAIEAAEAYPLSDSSTPTAAGMGIASATPTSRFLPPTPPRTPTLVGSQGAKSRWSGASEGTWRTLVSPKAFSRSKTKAPVRHGLSNLIIVPDSKPLSEPNSRQPSPHSSPSSSCRTLDIHPPSATKGSIFETPLSDLDYDYGLALDVLVFGTVNIGFDEDTAKHSPSAREAQSLLRYLIDLPPEMDILPPPTDPEKTSMTTFDTEIVFKRPNLRSASLSSSIIHQRRRQQSSRVSTSGLPPISVQDDPLGIASSPPTGGVKQKKSFFTQVSHLFVRS